LDVFVVKDEADFCLAFECDLGGTEVGLEVVAAPKGDFEGGGEGDGGGRGGNGSVGMNSGSSSVTERDKGGGRTSRAKKTSEKKKVEHK
jgi:hypothetical protein